MNNNKFKPSLVARLYRRHTGSEIAKILGISKSTVYRKLRKMNIPIRNNFEAQKIRLRYHKVEGRPKNKIKPPNAKQEKISEAYVIGVLMGDGYLTKDMIRLKVTQKDFMWEFARHVKKAYKTPIHIKQYEEKNIFVCAVHSVLLSKRIIKLTDNRSKIPTFIINGDKKIKGAFIRGIADSDGSVDDTCNRRQIVITQKNTNRLKDIKNLLLSLFIQSEIYEKSNNPAHLVISLLRNLKRFNEIVGFSIGYKKQKLSKVIKYLEKADISDFYWKALRKRINSDKSSQKLANEMWLKPGTYRSWVSGKRIPRQIKKDIKYEWVPEDYENLSKHFNFLPKVKKNH